MYRNIVLTVIAMSFVCLLLGMTVYSSPKIGVVRSTDLISQNDMMKEEVGRWHNMESELKARILGLESELKTLQQSIGPEGPSGAERSTVESKHRELSQLSEELHRKMAQRESEIMTAVLERINTVSQTYGEEHGFDVILGSSGDGNILYGRESVDITDAVLEALNKEYQNVD